MEQWGLRWSDGPSRGALSSRLRPRDRPTKQALYLPTLDAIPQPVTKGLVPDADMGICLGLFHSNLPARQFDPVGYGLEKVEFGNATSSLHDSTVNTAWDRYHCRGRGSRWVWHISKARVPAGQNASACALCRHAR